MLRNDEDSYGAGLDDDGDEEEEDCDDDYEDY